MANVITDVGREFIEDLTVGDVSGSLDTISVGEGVDNPSTSDTQMQNQIYEATSSSENTTIERRSVTGGMRFIISLTGGTEVSTDSEITELGIKSSNDDLVYHETRSTPITFESGETKYIEILLRIEDADDESDRVITDVGVDFIADRLLDVHTETINTIAVGQSTNDQDISPSNTTMFDELYRATNADGSVKLQSTTSPGVYEAIITLSAGSEVDDEVPGNSEISEFGIIASDGTLILHEIRNTVTLQTNDTKSFKIPFRLVQ